MRYFGTLVSRGGVVLRKLNGRFDALNQFGVLGGARVMERSSVSWSGLQNLLAFVIMVALIATAWLFTPHDHLLATSFVGLAIGRTATPPAPTDKKPSHIRQMESDLKSLLSELENGQIAMGQGPIEPKYGEELEQKAQEAEEIQGKLDQYKRIAGVTSKASQIQRATLPGESENISRKKLWTTPGHLFIASDGFENFKKNKKTGWSADVTVGPRLGRKVRLQGEEAVQFERKAFDPSQLSDLGTNAIIEIDRDPEIVRFEDPEILTIRDMLNNTSTTSDSVRYVRHISTTRGATTVDRAAPKPFLTVQFDATDAAVKTIAVLSKVTEQDIDDAPRLVTIINGEMTLDIKVEEERQLAWGDGTGNSLIGLFDPSINIPEFARSEAGDTLIDTIRRMRTDLRKRRMLPNFVAIDPFDWETIELEKGSDERYVWGLISDLRGPRIWSLRVVESDAMTNLETGERRILMGDGVRGATVYDRQSVQLAVGLMDDDFGRNLRTLRAEERLALAIKRAFAFEYTVTDAGGS